MTATKYHTSVILFITYLFVCAAAEVENFGKSFLEDVTLSVNEKEILDQFSQRVSFRLRVPYMKNEFFLVRWLRARQFNLEAAEQMLVNHLKWWDENQMDTIEQENWSEFQRDYNFWLYEGDREGRPVFYLNIGDFDTRKIIISGKSEQIIRYIEMNMEKGAKLIRKLGAEHKNVSQFVFIYNLKDFNLVSHGCLRCLSMLFRLITIYENHFPGYANKILIVNTPTAAQFIIDPARRVFHPETNKILRVYGAQSQWQPVLEKYIGSTAIPTDLGGSKVLDGRDFDY